MTSSVFFKFKSQKEPSRVEFDGTGISVFELKREIIIKSGLGDGTDFDLVIYNEDGSEEYDDDTTIIPRSTTIVARRLPPSKPGAGRAARYMSGKMPIHAKNNSRKEQIAKINKPHDGAHGMNGNAKPENAMTEEEQMKALFAAQSESWSAQQVELANQTPVFRSGGNKKGKGNDNDHEPPPGYVCYRCNETGHWIKNCPTNDNPEFDNKPRVKRTTGIPKSFLKEVEKPTSNNDGNMDDTKPGSVMLTAEGKYVTFEPNHKDWEKFQAKTKSSAAAQKAADLGDIEVRERGLECSIDQRMFIDPMKTPCCEKTYCNDCITNALIESDLACPGCQAENILIDDLKPDTETVEKLAAYLEEKNAAKKECSKSPSVKAEAEDSVVAAKSKSPSPASNSPDKSNPKEKSPKRESPKPESPNTNKHASSVSVKIELNGNKKRPAEEILENPKIPKGPKAMQQQEAAKALQKQQQLAAQQMAMMNLNPMMAGFPNMNNSMPFNHMAAMAGMTGVNGMGMNGFAFPGMSMAVMNMGAGTAVTNPMMGGFSSFNGMMGNMPGGGFQGGMGMGNNGGHMNVNATKGGGLSNMAGNGGRFQNQQRTVFSEPLGNEEDNAYFRQPVNPHRHQGKQRRARPSDWREV